MCSDQTQDENEQVRQRRAKLARLREQGNPFPNDFRRDVVAAELHARYGDAGNEDLAAQPVRVRVAGRLMSRRIMGKASFAHLQDMSGRIQLFVTRDDLPEGVYNDVFKQLDLGDIVGAEGVMFRTKTGELSVRVDSLRLLTKALRPLPEKFHGITDQELRYRQRYLDLVMNESTRRTFHVRTSIISFVRGFLSERGFLEVETPMMQAVPGGAIARPFETYHHALGMNLYLRIAPELYLKRLVVGGLERVFEINRNFRNEGVSTQHNPEFTMLEFYQAYAGYGELMDLTEQMLRAMASEIAGSTTIRYQGRDCDLGRPFRRVTVREAILQYNSGLAAADLDDAGRLRAVAERLGIETRPGWGPGKIEFEIFEKTVEDHLQDPVFVTAYPVEVSPLSRRNDRDPAVSDRFELYIAGREIANGFSELNDPEDQAERFREQLREKEAGDQEAMHFDEDYVRALEHGMPPTAGEGIGIDRLVMLFTDSPSIRDVLLFPHMRPADGSREAAGQDGAGQDGAGQDVESD